jgi:hypothetical protein
MSTSSSPDERTETAELTTDERHRLLSNGRRRAVLAVLSDRSTPVELADLAAAVADRETDAEAADEALVDRVKVSLHHVHLPRMDSLGVVEYEPRTCCVKTYRPVPDGTVA